ncbi:zona pellucida-like domain-containing protein 1 [Ambystoma mexicanum]|uniref:zona pellucida-like domain-containing protein 1 n=1 Tax=Ambystoma mexicanum TaxID=8296 RepID=UPI0037E842DD
MVPLEFISNNSYFRYKDDYYLQVAGTAMGATMAPSYTNYFMHKFESEKILQNEHWHSKLGLWIRYIDDIFGIWKDTEEELLHFFSYLNSIDARIQFTHEYSLTNIRFLDVDIKITTLGYQTTIFRKPTDRNNLLQRLSFHQPSLIKNLPYSQMLRVKRLVSDPEDYQMAIQEMGKKFLDRGYSEEEITTAQSRVATQSREDLLKVNTKQGQAPPLVFVSKYSCQSNRIKCIIKKHWNTLLCDHRVEHLFKEAPTFAYQLSQNSKDRLVQTKPALKKKLTTKIVLVNSDLLSLQWRTWRVVYKLHTRQEERTGTDETDTKAGQTFSVNTSSFDPHWFKNQKNTEMYTFYIIILLSCFHGYQCADNTTCNGTYRTPAYTDIKVTCGPQTIDLAIYLCPVYFSGYNESNLMLNSIAGSSACAGRFDNSTGTPFARFTFSINDTLACNSVFQTNNTIGDGVFKDFSNIQYMNISGMVKSNDPTVGTITYNPDLTYLYSCVYPMQYFLNNTRLDVTGNSIAITTNNGSFISTLSILLYVDSNYSRVLTIPPTGIYLRTRVFAEVKATNLTNKFNVLLDRCYATTSPFPANSSSSYDIFVGCTKDPNTLIYLNGDSQTARFSFLAFRFIEQAMLPMSSYYLHCITRLCLTSSCPGFKMGNCTSPYRRKRDVREVRAAASSEDISAPATVTSTGIKTSTDNVTPASAGAAAASVSSQQIVSTAVGLGITVGFLALLCILVGGFALLMHRRINQRTYTEKAGFH